jgi:hypothetical protein
MLGTYRLERLFDGTPTSPQQGVEGGRAYLVQVPDTATALLGDRAVAGGFHTLFGARGGPVPQAKARRSGRLEKIVARGTVQRINQIDAVRQ